MVMTVSRAIVAPVSVPKPRRAEASPSFLCLSGGLRTPPPAYCCLPGTHNTGSAVLRSD